MKTPKRHFELTTFLHDGAERVLDYTQEQVSTQRWKRKNRVAQLKRTIARLTDTLTAERRQFNELWIGDHLKRYSPEWDAFIQLRRLKTPAEDATTDEKFVYWVALREVGKSALNAACLAAMNYGEAKERAACHPETAESGQQACNAQNAENAKQGNLLCADAEQQTERKWN